MRKAPVCSVLLLLLLSAATGCSRYYWWRTGVNAEQFTQDSRACVRLAARTMPAGAALEAVEQYYRACLTSRGYVRDKQVDPPPPVPTAGSRAARSSTRRSRPPARRHDRASSSSSRTSTT